MSDWEIVDNNQQTQAQPSSDWEIVQPLSNSMRAPANTESFGMSALKAIPRAGEDLYRGLFDVVKRSPDYFNAVKEGLPAALEEIKSHPKEAAKQTAAGFAEYGQNVFNAPYDVANYLTNRLNLIPGDINQKLQMARMPSDTENAINQTFGQSQNTGQDFLRGLGRNASNVIGAAALARQLNPLRMTSRGIARNVVNTEKQQIAAHNKMYDAIWDKADKSGFNQVPFDKNLLGTNYKVINKFYPEKSSLSLKAFLKEPTLEHAQSAQSDLGNLRRVLEEKARTTPLLESEKALHQVLSESEKHIEGNMFKNAAGETSQALKDQYNKVTNSYRENVVPYKYNAAIQAYKNREMLAKELVNSLSRGEFAAKKGAAHPAIKMRQMVIPTASGVGTLGGVGFLYNQMFGNNPRD